MKFTCYVCGYPELDHPPRDENGSATFDICSCCGVEFGYEDATEESLMRYRERWILNGAKWFEEEYKPSDWNLREQLRNIGIDLE
jgi:hypothetical protein